jgi:deoxyadenosine/deoxycytidine kinase
VEVLRKRIAGRGRDYERGIDAGYLHGICDAYARFFYDYDRAPLLIVNAAEIDLVSGDADYAALLTRIEAIRGGRHYFNPLPLGEALR